MTLELACQIIIPLLSCTAVFLVTRTDDRSKLIGFCFGLSSQPFWIYTTWNHAQYGLFILSLFYTFQWTKGIVLLQIKEKVRRIYEQRYSSHAY